VYEVGLPPFVSIAGSGSAPIMKLSAGLLNGGLATKSFELHRAGTGFLFKNPSQVDHWFAALGQPVSTLKSEVSAVNLMPTAPGLARYAFGHFLGGHLLGGVGGTIEVVRPDPNVYNPV
jgi:hypothetical protein